MSRRASRIAAVFAVAALGVSAGPAAADAASGPSASRPALQISWHTAYAPHIANGLLEGITAPARSAVWAFGQTTPGHGSGYRFLLHWNGKQWRKSGMPVSGFRAQMIRSSAATNVWLFGVTAAKTPLALRWNGRRWLRLPGPSLATLGLQGASVISPSDVWAGAGINVEHWNGAKWTKMALPAGFELQQLASSSATTVWVAGTLSANGRLAAYRWRDGTWVSVAMPRLTPDLVGLTVQSAQSVWVSATVPGKYQRLLHWTGTATLRSVPDPTSYIEFPLAPYGRTGVWYSPVDLWTGRTHVSVTFPGGPRAVIPLELAAVPGSTIAWLAGQGLNGPVILHT